MKNKMHLSLLSLVGAILLFVFTSLAWFAVSDFISIDFFSGQVSGKDIDFELYESEDGLVYNQITEIEFDIAVPGDIKYYRLVLTNPENIDLSVLVVLDGVQKVMSNGAIYSGPAQVFEVISVETVIDSVVVVDDTLDQLLDGQSIQLTDTFLLGSGLSETIDFEFEISGLAGNEFQGLGLEIENIIFYFNE